MGAILGGTMRAPFTAILFVLELTHDINALVPLLIAVMVAYGFTVLFMRRSILTEKVSRRGYHLSREYATDPLEIIFVREVMRTNIAALSATISRKEMKQSLHGATGQNAAVQRLYPVLDTEQRLTGVVTRNSLYKLTQEQSQTVGDWHLGELVKPRPVVAYPNEPLRMVVYRMAESGFTRLPVVEHDDP